MVAVAAAVAVCGSLGCDGGGGAGELQRQTGILCVQSDHSIDIILRPSVSKLNVVKYIQDFVDASHFQIICLGDKGNYPGNDFELLSHPFSLSVDEVSADPNSCWNYSKPSSKNTDSTTFYFDRIKIFNGFFKIKL